MKSLPSAFLVLLILCSVNTFAQTDSHKLKVVASAGETYSAGDLQLNWTLGELSIEAVKGFENLITQGYHQGEFIMRNNIVGTASALEFSIFPNPSFDQITIDTKAAEEEMFVQLFDIEGQLLVSETIPGPASQHEVDLQALSPNTYILTLTSANADFMSSYKIIKLN